MVMAKLYIFILLVVCLHFSDISVSAAGMGPFDYTVTGVEECPDYGEGKFRFGIKQYYVSRKSITIDANMTGEIDLDDQVTLDIRGAEFSNGRWKENSFVKEFSNACSAIFLVMYDGVKKMLLAANVPESEIKCPIRKGTYSIQGFLVYFKFGVPVFVYNKYKGEARLKLHGKTVGCLRIYCEVFPKKHKKSRG